jgi:CheY-like chemotaxis protein
MVLNAREAMPQGGVVSVRAENVVLGSHNKPSLPPGDYVRVSIADRGGGIAKEMLPKIFDPYFSTKQRGDQKGMGLGLTICHTVIQKHGGAIDVESELGVGTTFHIHLPASRKGLGDEKASVPKILPRHGRILVMDDAEGMRKVFGVLLQRMGHEVELVEEGQRAIEVYRGAKGQGRPFDAVILDLTIRGGMGGQETILALRRIDPAAKAIVMSGYTDDPVVQEHERHGFEAALEKPFDIGKLQEVLSQVLGS